MFLGKLWRSIKAQFNKLGNAFASIDPVAQMQLEYDSAVEQLKEGRVGLEQYRALVERVTRQVENDAKQVNEIKVTIKHYLKAGDRETASRYALQLERAGKGLDENESQLALHETSYEDNLAKIKRATRRLGEIRNKITKYDAELKMSRAEAEMAQLATSFNFDVTTDFGQIEAVIQDRIDRNRGKARVASDMSHKGIADIEAEERMEEALAEQALAEFEVELGLATPETTPMVQTPKQLGPTTETEGS